MIARYCSWHLSYKVRIAYCESRLCLAFYLQYGYFCGVIERGWVGGGLPDDGFFETGDIFGDRDELLDGKISIFAEGFQTLEIVRTTQEQGIIDRHEPATIFDQWADFIGQPDTFVDQIDPALGCAGKEGRIEDHAVEKFPFSFEAGNYIEEIVSKQVHFTQVQVIVHG